MKWLIKTNTLGFHVERREERSGARRMAHADDAQEKALGSVWDSLWRGSCRCWQRAARGRHCCRTAWAWQDRGWALMTSSHTAAYCLLYVFCTLLTCQCMCWRESPKPSCLSWWIRKKSTCDWTPSLYKFIHSTRFQERKARTHVHACDLKGCWESNLRCDILVHSNT